MVFPANNRRLNMVVICVDTLREDFVSHRAPWSADTPNLDALRRRSVYFSRAFGEAQPTIPMRRAYFTGRRSFPWRGDFDTKGMWPTGRGWHKIPPSEPTLAEVLLAEGYHTGLISDTYHMFKPTMNFTRGFMSYEFIRGFESDPYLNGPIGPQDLAPYVRDPDNLGRHGALVQYLLNTRERASEADWTTAQVFSRAGEWVRRQGKQDPFFLWIDSFGVHEPWDPPAQYLTPYSSKQPSAQEFIYPVGMRSTEFSEAEAERVQALYRASVTFVDHWIGQFLTAVRESGQQNDTVVMVVNDHGTELLDHGQFSKAASRLYTHNTQLVWMIAQPGSPAQICDAFVQSHDLFPTALQILGVTPPESVEGTPLWVWEGKQLCPPRRSYVITGWGHFASVRDTHWTYFVDFENPATEYLFDLDHDRREMTNVVKDYPDEARAYRGILEDFLGQTLPARLDDVVYPSNAPIRVLLRSAIPQEKKDSGFV